ncbi:MAG: SRPBCC family protein [Rhizobiales bacterium]|nr:SRPBCC family protein [Hyphomicrobiales bacterium]MBI3672279.1 SRPBCC family protein [Hyphomicrobiales bacterium]
MRKLIKVLKVLIWIAVVVVVVFVGGAYLLPGEAVVDRNVVVAAPPAKIFAIVGHLRRFNEWSPWADIDPATQYVWSGPDSGPGQVMTWVAQNAIVGSGKQTVVAVIENPSIATEIEFGPMGTAGATLKLTPVDDKTTGVTWSFSSPLGNIFDRWAGLMIGRAVGADFEKGLAKLKALAEQQAAGG